MEVRERRMNFETIPIDKVKVSSRNVRKRNIGDDIEGLKKSIEEVGLWQPIAVVPSEDEEKEYEAVTGQRRLIALKKAGKEEVPAIVKEEMDEIDKTIASFVENVHRKKLLTKDMADACSYLMDELGSREKVAEVLGVSTQTVTKHLGLKYTVSDEVLEMTGSGSDQISKGDARKIGINVEDEDRQLRIAKKMVEEDLTRPEKDRAVDVIREEPDISEEEIVRKAREERESLEIVIHISGEYREAFENAADEEDLDISGLAKQAVEEWLEESGYA